MKTSFYTQMLAKSVLVAELFLMSLASQAQKTESISLKVENFDTYNISLRSETYKGKPAIVAEQTVDRDNDNRYSFARLKD
ncbi:MAG: hypothetical protein K2Q22_13600, partial [Cytophagales bacterium]|nr:hypothetical protein [Cytophagales bacterium]